MNPVKQAIELKEREVASYRVTADEFQSWKAQECTKKFMAEIELMMLEAYADLNILKAEVRGACIGTLENVLEWKPQELIKDE